MAGSRKPAKMTKRLGHALPEAEYQALLASQGGGCAICGAKPKTRRLHTDRDHKTLAVRGLLCHRCNRALPTWVTSKWLDAAGEYLDYGSPRGASWMDQYERAIAR